MRQTKIHLSKKEVWAVYTGQKLIGTFPACGSAFGETTPRVSRVTCKNCLRIIDKIRRQFCDGC